MWRSQSPSTQRDQESADNQPHDLPAEDCGISNSNGENKTRTIDTLTVATYARASEFGLKRVLRRVVDRQRMIDNDDGGIITYKEIPVAFVSILDDGEALI